MVRLSMRKKPTREANPDESNQVGKESDRAPRDSAQLRLPQESSHNYVEARPIDDILQRRHCKISIVILLSQRKQREQPMEVIEEGHANERPYFQAEKARIHVPNYAEIDKGGEEAYHEHRR